MRVATVWAGSGVVFAMTTLAACESDTDIRGEIVLGEPMSLDAIPGEPTSLGLLDDWVLVTSSRPVIDADPDLWGDTVVETLITWIDPEGSIGETTSLGWARARSGETPRWLAWEGELWASVRAGDPTLPSPEDRDYIRIVSVSPTDGIGCSVRPDLPVLSSEDSITVSTLTGAGGYHPATLTSEGPVFGLSAIPQACGLPRHDRFRPLLIRGCGEVSWLPEGEQCLAPDEVTGIVQLSARETEIGILAASARAAGTDPPTHWQRFADASSVARAVIVGFRRPDAFDGVPVPATVVLNDRVVWLDATDNPSGACSYIRTMSWAGEGADDAPWQPPCTSVSPDEFRVPRHRRSGTMTDLLRMGDVALFVSTDGPTDLDDVPSRAMLHALTADGRRASRSAELAGEPVFRVRAATEGNHGVVVYRTESHWLQRKLTWAGTTP